MLYLPEVKVEGQQIVIPGCYRLNLFSAELCRSAQPGQFLQIRVSPRSDPLLRRPISVHNVDTKNNILSLLYRVVGQGTYLLSQLKNEDRLDIIGPLGRGFSLPEGKLSVAVVAGGIGIAPLFFLLQKLISGGNRDLKIDILLGGQTAEKLLLADEIEKLAGSAATGAVKVATDDGSCGYHGNVTDLLDKLLAGHKVDMVYACGPLGMLRSTQNILNRNGVEGELSVEERMACGIGACFSCVCRTRNTEGTGKHHYSRVCVEGPVFKASEIVL